jgi:ribosomal protein S18 acetylase RimI-like enzyme
MAGYDGHRGWIYSMTVVPEKRNLNVGTTLLKRAENELKKLGCVKINLQIFKDNESVKDFYLKNGYSVEDRISMGKEIKANIQ